MTKKNFAKKSLLLLGACCVALTIFFSSESIRAQIQGLYDNSNNQFVGVSALMSAVTNNDITGVKFFSKAGRATVNQQNVGGATALHMACREKNFEIVKILVENEADVNAVDNEGWTPLMRGALAGDKDIVDLLLVKGAQASSINSSGESTIIHATISDCSDCLSSMFEKYNFIKLMDARLLKEQLTEAFVIARNREIQPAQVILEAYLDRVVKMDSFIESDTSVLTAVQSQRIFNFSSQEGKSQQFKEVIPMIAKRSPSTAIVAKRFKLVSGEDGKSLHDYREQNPNAISIEKQGGAKNYSAVRYKLLAPAAASNSEVFKNAVTSDQIKKSNRIIYLLKTPTGDKSEVTKTAAAANSEVFKNAAINNQIKKNNQTIYLLKTPTGDKSEVSKTAAAQQFVAPAAKATKEETSKSSSFKFSKGEAGKVVKHKKPKKPVFPVPTSQPIIIAPAAEILTPESIAAPVLSNDDKSIVIDLSNSSK